MGALIGGVIGGVGSLLGGSSKKSADNQAAQQSLTGFNYLNGNANNKSAQDAGTAATGAGAQTQNAESQLLGTAPITQQTQNGFNNYLNSTGYNFQMKQGQDAITGSAAARGLLGSGSTAKALTQYGQGLAGQTFNNYLSNLSGLNSQQQGTANAGLTASGAVGQAGSTGGGNASQATQAGGNAMGSGIGTAAGIAGGLATSSPMLNNFFGGL